MARRTNSDDARWADAAKHLIAADPVLGKVILRVGVCQISPRKDYFISLCRAIYAQQVSTRVAQVLFDRFTALCPKKRVTPEAAIELLKVESNIKAAGLSRQKAIYIRDLAEHFVDNRIPVKKLAKMTDEGVIEALIAVKGVGRWTAEMFLMFVLNRPDVLPVDDLGIREGMRDIFSLPERPRPKEMLAMGERWRPYRTVASWYIWRRNTGAENKGKSEPPIVERAKAAMKGVAAIEKVAKPKSPAAKRNRPARSTPDATMRRSGRARWKS